MGKENNTSMDRRALENSEAPQLALFSIVESGGKPVGDYSSTIEIYDALPKYVWEARPEADTANNAVITRKAKLRGVEYSAGTSRS